MSLGNLCFGGGRYIASGVACAGWLWALCGPLAGESVRSQPSVSQGAPECGFGSAETSVHSLLFWADVPPAGPAHPRAETNPPDKNASLGQPSPAVPGNPSRARRSSPEAEEIQRQADQILSRPEFRRVRDRRKVTLTNPAPPAPGWWSRFLNWLGQIFDESENWMSRMLPSGWDGSSSKIIVYVAWALLFLVCMWLLWKLVLQLAAYRRRRMPQTVPLPSGSGAIAPGEIPADEYLSRALNCAAQGDYRAAIAHLVAGAKSCTERAGLIRFRQGLTHCDYVRAWKNYPVQQAALRQLVGVYEPICFGRRAARREHYESSSATYREGFHNA